MKCLPVFAMLMCCAVWGNAASVRKHHRRPLQRGPLDNSETWNNLRAVAEHAQEMDRNHTTRLIPLMSQEKLKNKESCCMHANILNYYIRNVLTKQGDHHERLPIVKDDLERVEKDLKEHAKCDPRKYDENEYNQKFRANYEAAGIKASIKAISEIDILFHYLYESCNYSLEIRAGN
ncbi:interleukin-22 [Clupea harengus]|uniref:Interleukin-22 n=1 Tax=Clupea harengus TaxID=7950 RepID=A0A8M1K9D1_CLUHA|nr:interleukin-22 [Clupea harengus]